MNLAVIPLRIALRRWKKLKSAVAESQPNWRDTTLDEPWTYLQQILAEHDAATAKEHTGGYRSEDKTDEEPIARHAMPSGRRLRVVSTDDIPPQHTRIAPISKTQLSPSDSGGMIGELDRDIEPEECILQGDAHGSEATRGSSTPATPRPRAKSLLNTQSELRLDEYNSCAPNYGIQRSAALLALAGVHMEPGEAFSRESSGHWLGGPARRYVFAARRRGRADCQKSGLFSSTG